jgi:cytochrome c-type biogenesis protein CcmE
VRDIVLTVSQPVAVMSQVTGNVVTKAAQEIPDIEPHFIASALAIITGAIICFLGLARLGWIVEFIPLPAICAFMTGSAVNIAAGQVPVDTRIRAGGCVQPGSVVRDATSLRVGFQITDGGANLQVYYSGILPDLFAEGEAVVVNGMMRDDGAFHASEVLAKHDEQYMPPEVASAMSVYEDGPKSCGEMDYGA